LKIPEPDPVEVIIDTIPIVFGMSLIGEVSRLCEEAKKELKNYDVYGCNSNK